MVTTDRSTCQYGYSRSDATRSTFARGGNPNESCNYTNTFNGTSSAAPSTSGAIALLLDARPSLTWREVKHILAATAIQVDPTIAPRDVELSDGAYVAEPAWTVNGAGYHFHNWYGFGAVNVDAAIGMARTFVAGSLGLFQQTPWVESAVGAQAIPDDSRQGVTSVLAVPAQPAALVVEEMQIEVVVDHPEPGDLGFELVSPAGTRSVLMNVRNGFGHATGRTDAVMLSNAFYGERAVGNWTLRVVDGLARDTGSLVQWRIRAYGH
jgi:subtilisin-like proprotein convertase family protein